MGRSRCETFRGQLRQLWNRSGRESFAPMRRRKGRTTTSGGSRLQNTNVGWGCQSSVGKCIGVHIGRVGFTSEVQWFPLLGVGQPILRSAARRLKGGGSQ